MIDDFDYWTESQYYPFCKTCNQRYNPYTRWCSKDCWINQRSKYNNNNFDFDNDNNTSCHKNDNYNNYNNDVNMEYWNILKLIPPKNKDQIKKQYYKLCLKYHPDKGGDNDKFIELKDAYDKLLL